MQAFGWEGVHRLQDTRPVSSVLAVIHLARARACSPFGFNSRFQLGLHCEGQIVAHSIELRVHERLYDHERVGYVIFRARLLQHLDSHEHMRNRAFPDGCFVRKCSGADFGVFKRLDCHERMRNPSVAAARGRVVRQLLCHKRNANGICPTTRPLRRFGLIVRKLCRCGDCRFLSRNTSSLGLFHRNSRDLRRRCLLGRDASRL
mmetsp:Transcript_20622/g.62929  ORF Transcript_20622/g.62929 Transcript_20622/m.62929 type:complete len:204 (-) Transcript_20622:2033-2644(-)